MNQDEDEEMFLEALKKALRGEVSCDILPDDTEQTGEEMLNEDYKEAIRNSELRITHSELQYDGGPRTIPN
jgi:hypothetical protein